MVVEQGSENESLVSGNGELLENEPIFAISDGETSVLDLDTEPITDVTDSSRYESTVEAFSEDGDTTDVTDSEVVEEHDSSTSYDSDSASPVPDRPTSSRRSTRNVNPPQVFTYNRVGGNPSYCHRNARFGR